MKKFHPTTYDTKEFNPSVLLLHFKRVFVRIKYPEFHNFNNAKNNAGNDITNTHNGNQILFLFEERQIPVGECAKCKFPNNFPQPSE